MKRRFQFKSIRERFTFWLLLIAILPLIAAIFVISIYEEQSHQKETFNKLEAIRDIKVAEVNNWLDEISEHVRTIALDSEIRGLGENTHRLKLEDKQRDIKSIVAARNMLIRHKEHFPSFDEIYLVCNHTGKILISTKKEHEGLDCSRKLCVVNPRENNGLFISDSHYSEGEGSLRMDISMPVHDLKDENIIIAIMVASINLDRFMNKLFENAGLGDTGETFVVSKDAIALSRLRWHKDAPFKLKINAKPAIEASRGNTGIIEAEDYRGVPVLAAYTYIPITGWGFVAKQDLSEIYAPIYKLRMWIFAVWFTTVLIVMILVFRISRSITEPIKALVTKTEKIGRGEWGHKVGTDAKDEIGELSRMFDLMTENLSATTASRDELNKEITERKKIEELLRKEYGFNKNILETAQAIILILDVNGRILQFNPYMEELSGYRLKEVVGKDWFSTFLPHSDHDRIRDLFRKALGNVQTKGNVNPIVSKDGREIFIEWYDNTLKDENGNIIGLLAIGQDITERRKSEMFIKNVLETVREGFIVVDREYRILSANRAFCKQVNMPIGEVIGKHCYRISHHIDRPCHESGEDCSVKMAFETGKPYNVMHTHYDKDGAPIYIETNSYPLKDVTGEFNSVIETTNDITDRIRLEKQLIHSQKMEAVGQLAGGVAHDFNNILSAIISYGHILQMKIKDEEQAHNVSQILASAERAANLTASLLTFAKKQIINPLPVKLNNIVNEVEKLLLRLIGENIEIKKILADGDPTIMADSGQIAQVLMNLVTNARDAMPEGGTITIETGNAEIDDLYAKRHGYGTPGAYAVLSVTDTGTGMNEKTRDKIFEPFFTTKDGGTGLGLSIIYGIIKQHNGHISIGSAPGKGTKFKFYLPLSRAEVGYPKPAQFIVSNTGTETVLIADDDHSVRQSLKKILEEFGYTVIEAKDGEEAIDSFMKNRDHVALLILDVILKKKNGKEVYNEIMKERPDIKVLFISGYTSDIIHKKGLLDKGINFMSKPFSPGVFLREIREILDK